jgi:diguanylate cyclase (GGDEF)-like protein/PAS domain S-box-containing protein
VGNVTRLDRVARERVLDALLMEYPTARVVAIDPSGAFVPVPEGVPLTTHREIQPIGRRTALDMVVASDRAGVVDAWLQAHASGAGSVIVHSATEPEHLMRMHFVDVTERIGLFFGVFVGQRDGSEDEPRSELDQVLPPRLATLRRDELSVTVDADHAATMLLGWSTEELVGERLYLLMHPDDQDRAVRTWIELLGLPPGSTRRARLRIRHHDGTWLWFEATHYNRLDDPDAPGIYTELLDISDEMAAHEALRAAEQLLRRLTEALPIGVLQVDVQGRLIHRNERITEIVGMPAAETLAEQFSQLEPDDRITLDGAVAKVLADGGDVDIEVGLRRCGEAQRCGIGLRALTADSGAVTGVIVCVTDVTEMVRARRELEHRATFDPLTGCHNRASTIASLQQVMAECPPTRGTAAVFVDLDGFKQINDSLGHAAGDTVLRRVVDCLTGAVRAGDLVGRLGGDEFLVICREVETPAAAERLGGKLAAAIRTDVPLDGVPVVPRGSVGVAWARGGTGTAQELIAEADRAMYRCKKASEAAGARRP